MIMNIVCATDNNYVQHCGVMLTSLFENNKGEEIHVYLLTEGLNDLDKASIENIISKYNGYFHYCMIDGSFFLKCPIRQGDHVSIATYYRFLIPQILPTTESKALYLDCDIIIRKSLKDLFDISLGDFSLAAVDESGAQRVDSFTRLQYEPTCGYFNAGVLLINLDYWRERDIQMKLFNYIHSYPDRIVYHDQDTLNAVLHDCWLPLSPKWNMMEFFYTPKVKFGNDSFYNDIRDPIIRHYNLGEKPWHYGYHGFFKQEYFKYLKMTEWREFKVKFNFKQMKKKCIQKIIFFFSSRNA